jgi:hypothetical protein
MRSHNVRLVGNPYLTGLWKGPLSAHDQQTLGNISLPNWRFTSAAVSQAFL